MREFITCAECPHCKDIYPNEVDANGYPFQICDLGGNIVHTKPWKEKRCTGGGYIHHDVSSCRIFEKKE